ncbi:MAG TPA: hypothetical protein V6C46_09170 [Coleofasciculaceae cyanobacterium]
MKIPYCFQRAPLKRRASSLAVIVLANEATAFQAYRLLHYHGVSPENLAIVGKGYSSPERVGLLSPGQIIRRIAWKSAALAVALGLSVSTVISFGLNLEPTKLAIIISSTVLVSGICGAVIGALFGLLGDGSTASIYRHHLKQGHYLLMIEGPENLVRWGQEVMGHYSAHV